MLKSPLRYPGGKSRAIKSIAPLVPTFDEFREPFVGGGSVFIHHKQKESNKSFWINDLYTPLYAFWKIAQENMEALLKQVWFWKKEYGTGKKLYRFLKTNLATFPEVQLASAFFILNRITFSGTSESGGFSNMAFQKRFTESSIERVAKLENLLQDIRITNTDYQKVVETSGKNVFIFLDPPYYSATSSALYGKNGNLHKGFDHERFASVMKACPHQWLITYDDSPFVRDLFDFAHIFEWKLTYGMRNVNTKSNQQATEIFISNYLESPF